MKITTKELRIQPGKILEQVANGQDIIVTFRGKSLAKIVSLKTPAAKSDDEKISIFGLWKNHEDSNSVENYVRNLRRGRTF